MDKQLAHSCPSTEHSWAWQGGSISFRNNAVIVSVCRGEERAESKGEALD